MSVNPEIMMEITRHTLLVAKIQMVLLSVANFNLDRLPKISTNTLSHPYKQRLATEGLALIHDIQFSLFNTLHTEFGVGEVALCQHYILMPAGKRFQIP